MSSHSLSTCAFSCRSPAIKSSDECEITEEQCDGKQTERETERETREKNIKGKITHNYSDRVRRFSRKKLKRAFSFTSP